ncbi:MAG TPA: sugar-binding protein, partial [Ohtaekwangia sp.]|uniref:sugar-binding protein n=1 Tax=Ohtaekwangia sp. TaxID=2066019 RepID=UPI002F922AA7
MKKTEHLSRRRLTTSLLVILNLFLLVNHAIGQNDGIPRGAQLPYIRYESENGALSGGATLQQALNFDQNQIASEATNQRYVSLAGNGASVEWTTTQAAQGFDIRFTMPDNGSGTGQSGSLGIYVNGSKVKNINLSSYWAYQYFPGADPVQTPGGKTFMRFDEVHFRLDNVVPQGATIKIQKDNGDAITYGVDYIELEPVPAALTLPANFLSVETYGANGSDQNDDLAAFNQCITAAASQGKGVYIPTGRFILSDKLNLNVSNIKIQGAGIWYTEIYFSTDRQFYGGIFARASNVEISNFSLNTANNDRMKYDEANPRVPAEQYKIYKGFMGTYGNNSRIHDVWVEHFECGFWIAGYDPPYPIDVTNDLIITRARIRNNYADGVNFCQGTSNSVVEYSDVRNNGDDGLAVWPANAAGNTQTCRNNIFRYCTVENNWRAGGAALFGGTGHQIYRCIFKDGVGGSGIRFTNDFGGFTFENAGTPIVITDNYIVNCGTTNDLWNQKRGAIEFYANSGIFNIEFNNTQIINSQRHAVQLYGSNIRNIVFNNTKIDGTGMDFFVDSPTMDDWGGYGILAQAGSEKITFNNVSFDRLESGQVKNYNSGFIIEIVNTNIPVTGITLAPATLSLAEGKTSPLTVTFSPTNATNKNLTWSSSNTSVASVAASGTGTATVTANAIGTTIITATSADGNFSKTCTVTVTPAVNITATDPDAGEGGNTGTFRIATSATSSNITVNYTIAGTASSGDYTASPALSGSVVLTPAAPAANITITPIDDSSFEGSETLQLTLQAGSGFTLGANTSAAITIADNDNPPCTAPVVAQVSGTAPVINQTIESAWSIAPTRAISNVTIGALPSDYSGRWRALYNSSNLYLLVEVNDATRQNDSGANWWEDDVVEIFIDGDNSKGTTYDGQNDFQYGFRWNDAAIKTGGNSVSNTSGIVFSMYASGNGYILEASIPWSTIGVTPALGKAIGLDIQVDDDDNGGTRDAQTASFATNTTAWQNPSVFGTVYLTTCSGPVNQPPVANAGSDLSLASGTTSVTLNGSGSDPDGTAVTYSWTKVSGPAATITNATTASPTVSGLTNGSIYVFQLTVSDGSLTATDQVQVSVAGTSGDPAGVITCYQRVSTITVDGTLNESSWNVTRAVSKNTVNTPNNTVTFGVLWDNTNLYIGVKVLDASLYNDSPDIWENDAVEIYIDANNNKLSTYDGRDNQFIKGYNNSTLFAKLSVTGVQHAWA